MRYDCPPGGVCWCASPYQYSSVRLPGAKGVRLWKPGVMTERKAATLLATSSLGRPETRLSFQRARGIQRD